MFLAEFFCVPVQFSIAVEGLQPVAGSKLRSIKSKNTRFVRRMSDLKKKNGF